MSKHRAAMKRAVMLTVAAMILDFSLHTAWCQPSEPRYKEAFVLYHKTQMMIASNDKEVAAIVIIKTTAKSIEYKYRLLKTDGSEHLGTGEVVFVESKEKKPETKESKTESGKSESHFKAGSIQLTCWPFYQENGIVLYQP